MTRRLLLPAIVLLVFCVLGGTALLAQAPAPSPGPAPGMPGAPMAAPVAPAAGLQNGWSGPGFYLSWIKIASFWLMFLVWVGTTDWANRDGQINSLDYLRWNPIVFGPFVGAFILAWLIPWFWFGLPLILIAHATPLTFYVLYRNKKLEEHQRVMTKAHLRYWFAVRLNKVGFKFHAEPLDPHSAGAPIVVSARGGPTPRDEGARLILARQAPGLKDARKVLAEGLSRRADAIMVDYTAQAVTVRHLVDGVWHNGEPLEREVGDPALEALKILCGLNPQDRQNRQEGKLAIDYFVLKQNVFDRIDRAKSAERKRLEVEVTKELNAVDPPIPPAELELRKKATIEERVRVKFVSATGPWTPIDKSEVAKIKFVDKINPETSLDAVKAVATLSTVGTPNGERAVIQFEGKKNPFKSLDELGMRPKMQEQLKELMHRERGFLLFSAMPANGLRTSMYVVLKGADRFMREFVAAEEETVRYDPVENVPVTVYKAAAGQTPANVLPHMFHQDPNVVVVRDLVNAETTRMLLDQIPKNRLIISTMRSRDAVEAIYRVLALKVPPSDLAPAITAVVNQRLVRKLCEHCKEPYSPPAQTLAQLGLPPGRVQAFYRPPQPSAERDEVCPVCQGIGYQGRTAIFEMLVVDDTVRKAIASGVKPDVVRQVARQAGFRGLQEEGILLVAKGITSLPELIRAMKEGG